MSGGSAIASTSGVGRRPIHYEFVERGRGREGGMGGSLSLGDTYDEAEDEARHRRKGDV